MFKRKISTQENGEVELKRKKEKIICSFEDNFPVDVFSIICSFLTSNEWYNFTMTGNKYILNCLMTEGVISSVHWRISLKKEKIDTGFRTHSHLSMFRQMRMITVINPQDISDTKSKYQPWSFSSPNFIRNALCNLNQLCIVNSLVIFIDFLKMKRQYGYSNESPIELYPYYNSLERLHLRKSGVVIVDRPSKLKFISLDIDSLFLFMNSFSRSCRLIGSEQSVDIEIIHNEHPIEVWEHDIKNYNVYVQFLYSLITLCNHQLISNVILDDRVFDFCLNNDARMYIDVLFDDAKLEKYSFRELLIDNISHNKIKSKTQNKIK